MREPSFRRTEVDRIFRKRQVEEDRHHGGAVYVVRLRLSRRTWGDDGTIVFSPRLVGDTDATGVSTGGTPTPLAPESDTPHALAQILPAASRPLTARTVADFNDAELIVQPLSGGAPKVVTGAVLRR